jgi:hypothetical protein
MTQAILTQILNQLETLELKELQQLNQKIQQYRDYEKKYLNKTITAEERAQAAKLKQELNF